MKTTKVLAILILGISIQSCCHSQIESLNAVEINPTKEHVDSLVYAENYGNDLKRRIANNLYLIHQFNFVKRRIGQTDTIRIFKNDSNYSASYKSKRFSIKDKIIKEENLIYIWGRKGHTTNVFISETFDKNGKSQRITLSISKLNSEKSSIKIENFTNEIISGSYKELKLNAEPIMIGNYFLKDSIYQDSLITLDYETYEELVEIKMRNQIGVKCGEWIHYNKDGQLEIVKHQKSCK